VHYAGVGCEMKPLLELASSCRALVIEDAAQGLLSTYRGQALGSLGQLGALSFHETKNVTCGEGGALLVNDQAFAERAEIIREKGTNRSQFYRGQVDKYTWVDLGSSHVLSDLNAAFLWGQLERAETITRKRLEIWRIYHEAFEELEAGGQVRRPIVPEHCAHNAHLYYLLANDERTRDAVIAHLNEHGVNAVFHYVPLHSSPGGRRYGRSIGELPVTDEMAGRLLRLPLYTQMTLDEVERVVEAVFAAVAAVSGVRG
jgi:dTDP-4-amino-4,6-dideoxygalactose transaminase